jgi:hypothetical protein
MKSTGAIQIVIVLLLVASAASCEVAKEYSTRVFKPAMPQKKSDSTGTALKFMQFDSGNASDSVDVKELFAKSQNENDKQPEVVKDSVKTDVAVIENKVIPRGEPIDATKRNASRSKKVRQ